MLTASAVSNCTIVPNTYMYNFLVSSLQDMKLVVLTVPEGGVCDLKVQSLPSWETVYNLQLNASSMLAKCNTFQVTFSCLDLVRLPLQKLALSMDTF